MSQESYKAAARRMRDNPQMWTDIFTGRGIDLGCGNSPIGPEHYPKITKTVQWDKCIDPKMDVTNLPFDDGEFDWVHSSHCLEHVHHPEKVVLEWMRVLKPGGVMVITVPDFVMYEREQWPSRFNPDHKTIWTFELCNDFANEFGHYELNLITEGFDPSLSKHVDQTREPYNAECAIEMIVWKGQE